MRKLGEWTTRRFGGPAHSPPMADTGPRRPRPSCTEFGAGRAARLAHRRDRGDAIHPGRHRRAAARGRQQTCGRAGQRFCPSDAGPARSRQYRQGDLHLLGADLEALTDRRSTSPSGSWPRRSARSSCGSVAVGRAATETPSFAARPRRPSGSPRIRVDAAGRAHREEHLRLARPAVADYGREIRTLDAIPDEELETLARGRDRPVADRAVGALAGVRADQALARQRRRGRLGLFARRLPDRRRPRRRGGLRAPARPGLGARHPPRERHGPEPHGDRFALGDRAPEWFLSLPNRPTRPTRSPGRPVDDPRVGIVLEDHYWDDSDAAVVFKRFDRDDRRRALRLPRQRRHELPVERHRPAGLPRAGRPRAGHPDDPRRRPPVPGHPVRRGDGPRQEAHRATVVAGARHRRRRSRRGPSTRSRRPSSTG